MTGRFCTIHDLVHGMDEECPACAAGLPEERWWTERKTKPKHQHKLYPFCTALVPVGSSLGQCGERIDLFGRPQSEDGGLTLQAHCSKHQDRPVSFRIDWGNPPA